jgi:phosphopantetheine adenylyltransferase
MQKEILKEFITSVDNTPRLKEFYNNKIEEIKTRLNKLTEDVKDKAIQIKLTEVNNLLKPLGKTSSVGNDDLVNLLQYCELLEELHSTNA